MSRLHLVFNVVKLTLAPVNPIPGRQAPPPPPPELVDGEEEYVMEKVLNSRMFQCKLQYLVKWEGYSVEENTWEYWDNLNNVADAVNDFHRKNPGAPHHIRTLIFGSIPFRLIPPVTYAPSRRIPEGGVIVMGTPSRPTTADSGPVLTLRPTWSRPRLYNQPGPGPSPNSMIST